MPPLTTWLSWLFCLVCVIASVEIATSSAYTWLKHDATITEVPDQGYVGVQHDAVRHYYPGRQRRILLSFLLGIAGGGSSFVVGLMAWQRQGTPVVGDISGEIQSEKYPVMPTIPFASASASVSTIADTLVAVADHKLNHHRPVTWQQRPAPSATLSKPERPTVIPSSAELNALAQSLSQELNLAPSGSILQERIQVSAKGKTVEQVLELAGLPERLVLPGHPDWSHLVGHYPQSGHPWFDRSLGHQKLREALQPYFSGPYEWLKYVINAGLLIVTGSQGAAKTTLIAFICRIRTLLLGHDLHIIDRHVRLGQWQPYEVFGYGANRPEQVESVIAGIKAFKQAIAHNEQLVKTTADPQLSRTTYVFEELLEWRDFVPEDLVRTVFTDISAAIRKACKNVILASQGGTLETWGGGKALAGLREVLDQSSVQINLHCRPGDLFLGEDEFVPTFSGQIRICNGEWQDIHLPAWFFVPQDFLDISDPTVQAQCLAQLQSHVSSRNSHLTIVQ